MEFGGSNPSPPTEMLGATWKRGHRRRRLPRKQLPVMGWEFESLRFR